MDEATPDWEMLALIWIDNPAYTQLTLLALKRPYCSLADFKVDSERFMIRYKSDIIQHDKELKHWLDRELLGFIRGCYAMLKDVGDQL